MRPDIFRLRHKYKFLASLVGGLIILFLPFSASAILYQPGQTLDPACLPTDISCGVSPFSLNGLAVSPQTFAVGTAGTDFGIISSGSVHTFNIPNASASARGLLTTGDWTTFNNKLSSVAPTISTSATVPLVIGGVAPASTLTLRSTSGVGATGADIIFQTGNNGATEAVRILNNGNVGIGTANPVSHLNIVDTATVGTRGLVISQHTTDAAAPLAIFRKSRGTEVSPTAVANGDYLGSVSATAYDGTAYIFNGNFGYHVNNTVSTNNVPGEWFFAASGSDDTNPYLNNTVRMVIQSTGNVGIGTTTPKVGLQVGNVAGTFSNLSVPGSEAGTIGVGGVSVGRIYVQGSSQADITLDDTGAGVDLKMFQFINKDGVWRIRSLSDDGNVKIDPILAATSDGNVGIGTTSPGNALDIRRTAAPVASLNWTNTNSYAEVLFTEGAGLTQTGGLVAYGSTFGSGLDNSFGLFANNGGNVVLQTGTGGTSTAKLIVLNNGQVGIGTTSPTEALTVLKSGTTMFRVGDSDTGGSMVFGQDSTLGPLVLSHTDSSGNSLANAIGLRLAFGANGFIVSTSPATTIGNARTFTERFRIEPANGNVGIGTPTPGTILDIGSSDLGAGSAGPIITLGRNTNATNTGAGSINFQNKAGTAGYVWQDNSGLLRINTASPTHANDAAGTVVGSQSSSLDSKNLNGQFTDYSGALNAVSQAPLYNFTYKSGAYNGQEFTGIVTDYSPTFGMDRDATHPSGKSLNVPTAIGYSFGAIRQLNQLVGDSGLQIDADVTAIQSETPPDPIKVIGDKIIHGMETLTNFAAARVTAIRGYFDEIFAKKVHTEQVCLKNSNDNEVCLNAEQLDTLLKNSASPLPTAPSE